MTLGYKTVFRHAEAGFQAGAEEQSNDCGIDIRHHGDAADTEPVLHPGDKRQYCGAVDTAGLRLDPIYLATRRQRSRPMR